VQMYGSDTFGTGATLTLKSGAGKDLSVRNVGSSTDLLIDVTGFYVPQLYAYIAPDGTVIDHSGRVQSVVRNSVGTYSVTWDRNVDGCAGIGSSDISGYIVSVYTAGNISYVYVDDNAGNSADYWVNVSVHC